MNDEFRITLKLTEKEFLAIARLGHKDLRSPRNQARLLLRDVLIERGALAPDPSHALTPNLATR